MQSFSHDNFQIQKKFLKSSTELFEGFLCRRTCRVRIFTICKYELNIDTKKKMST